MKIRDLFDWLFCDWFLVLFFGVLSVVPLAGYALNIFKLVSNNETIGFVVARACGVFMPPLGVVLGFL